MHILRGQTRLSVILGTFVVSRKRETRKFLDIVAFRAVTIVEYVVEFVHN